MYNGGRKDLSITLECIYSNPDPNQNPTPESISAFSVGSVDVLFSIDVSRCLCKLRIPIARQNGEVLTLCRTLLPVREQLPRLVPNFHSALTPILLADPFDHPHSLQKI